MRKKNKEFTVISLFSGGGGMSLGFQEAGFKILLATDNEKESENTHILNWKSMPFIRQDISTITKKQLNSILGNSKPDIVIGGPPCQGFSNMGDKSGSDPRNYLIEGYLRLVEYLQPTCLLLENVTGMKTKYDGYFYGLICNTLASSGYEIYSRILNSVDYGVPQIRKRLFIFGTRHKNSFRFPLFDDSSIGKLRSCLTVGEAINDLAMKNGKMPNHESLNHSERVIERYKLIKEGGKLPPPNNLPKEIRRKNFGNTYERLHRKKPSTTMVPGNNAFPIHPFLHRSLTPREAARLQSFPDDHIFSGNRSMQCKLVGNAVPPFMAAHLAKEIMKHLNDENNARSGRIKIELFDDNQEDLVCKRFESIAEPKRITKRNLIKFVELFSGAGGITQGLKQAGLEGLLAVEIDKHAAKVHHLNHPEIPMVEGDLTNSKVEKEVLARVKDIKVDLLVGGPPCQGFSIFGSRRYVKTRGFDPFKDSRNDLIRVFWNYAKKINPDWVVMENVPGFQSLGDGYYLDEAMSLAKKFGFKNVEYKVLNAASYGIPQIRKRFIMIATKTDLVIPWPKQKFFFEPKDWQASYRTVGEVLTDLDDIQAYENLSNHVSPKHAPVVTERFSYIKEGKKLEVNELPSNLKKGVKTKKTLKNFSHVFKRLHRDYPSSTMVPGHNAFPVHPWLDRTLTIREVARIQTFPDNYIFKGPIIQQGLQVGNAFPCLLAQVIGERLIRVIKNGWTAKTVTDLAKYSMLNV